MKTTPPTAAQIDTLAQRRSETPIEPATSAKKAGDTFARLPAARIGTGRAALAFTSIMTAETFDQAGARLTLVLGNGNPDPAGATIPAPADEPKAAPDLMVGKRAGHPRSGADRRAAERTGFLHTDPRPVPRQAGPDRGAG